MRSEENTSAARTNRAREVSSGCERSIPYRGHLLLGRLYFISPLDLRERGDLLTYLGKDQEPKRSRFASLSSIFRTAVASPSLRYASFTRYDSKFFES